MERLKYKDYFLQPVEGPHKRYEAVRLVVVDQKPMRQVAQHFEVSYGTVRNWVSEFCQLRDAGQSPPFSFH